MSSKFLDWVTEFQLAPSGLIHVGAHLVQERDEYRNSGFEPVIWFEASPATAYSAKNILKNYSNQSIINCALWSEPGIRKTFHIAGNEGSSSSLLEPYLITASHPDVYTTERFTVETSTLDKEIPKLGLDKRLRTLVLDVQGAEIEVLKGSTVALTEIDYIITEISRIELYKNTTRIKQIVQFLDERGFIFAASEVNRATGWGEGLFIRKSGAFKISGFTERHVVVGKRVAKGRFLRTLLIKVGVLNLTHKIRKKNN